MDKAQITNLRKQKGKWVFNLKIYVFKNQQHNQMKATILKYPFY
jgi:hypothetical protein